MPSSAQVVKHLGHLADADSPLTELGQERTKTAVEKNGAADRIVAHATGKLPDESVKKKGTGDRGEGPGKNGQSPVPHYDGPDEEFEFDEEFKPGELDDLAAEALKNGDTVSPTNSAIQPKTVTIHAPKLGGKNSRRKAAGVKR